MHSCNGCGIHRRTFLADLGMGFTGLALGAMLHRDGVVRASESTWAPPDGFPHFRPRAKSVIWLFMNGGMSHLETFDPKPEAPKEIRGEYEQGHYRRFSFATSFVDQSSTWNRTALYNGVTAPSTTSGDGSSRTATSPATSTPAAPSPSSSCARRPEAASDRPPVTSRTRAP